MDVSIVSPEKKVWSGDADMVVARSPEGEFAILRGHTPFLAALVPGRVAVLSEDRREEFFVPGGFLEASGSVDDYHVIVLADDAESLGNIDLQEARNKLDEIRRHAGEGEDERAQAEIQVAAARVRIAESRG